MGGRTGPFGWEGRKEVTESKDFCCDDTASATPDALPAAPRRGFGPRAGPGSPGACLPRSGTAVRGWDSRSGYARSSYP